MEEEEVGKTNRTITRERLLTKEEVARVLPRVELPPEEEIVIRLRYGVGLAPEGKLSFRGEGNEDLEAKLALIEASILEHLENEKANQSPPESLDNLFKDL